MTTPRDDIAGLSERLNLAINRLIDGDIGDGDIEVATLAEAATAADERDSLLKERDALQARVKELESGIAHAQYRSDNCDAENHSLYNRLEAVESRATRIQQERDEAIAALKPFAKVATTHPVTLQQMGILKEVCAARDLVRRLAGPEKEKKG